MCVSFGFIRVVYGNRLTRNCSIIYDSVVLVEENFLRFMQESLAYNIYLNYAIIKEKERKINVILSLILVNFILLTYNFINIKKIDYCLKVKYFI